MLGRKDLSNIIRIVTIAGNDSLRSGENNTRDFKFFGIVLVGVIHLTTCAFSVDCNDFDGVLYFLLI